MPLITLLDAAHICHKVGAVLSSIGPNPEPGQDRCTVIIVGTTSAMRKEIEAQLRAGVWFVDEVVFRHALALVTDKSIAPPRGHLIPIDEAVLRCRNTGTLLLRNTDLIEAQTSTVSIVGRSSDRKMLLRAERGADGGWWVDRHELELVIGNVMSTPAAPPARPLVAEMADFLNEVFNLDAEGLGRLAMHRELTTQAVAEHPTIQVSERLGDPGDPEAYSLSMIGLLNGFLTRSTNRDGYLAVKIDDETKAPIGFCVAPFGEVGMKLITESSVGHPIKPPPESASEDPVGMRALAEAGYMPLAEYVEAASAAETPTTEAAKWAHVGDPRPRPTHYAGKLSIRHFEGPEDPRERNRQKAESEKLAGNAYSPDELVSINGPGPTALEMVLHHLGTASRDISGAPDGVSTLELRAIDRLIYAVDTIAREVLK